MCVGNAMQCNAFIVVHTKCVLLRLLAVAFAMLAVGLRTERGGKSTVDKSRESNNRYI